MSYLCKVSLVKVAHESNTMEAAAVRIPDKNAGVAEEDTLLPTILVEVTCMFPVKLVAAGWKVLGKRCLQRQQGLQ